MAIPPTPKGPQNISLPTYSPVSPLPLDIDPYLRSVPGAKAVKNVYEISPTPKAETLSDHYGTDKYYNLYGPQRKYNFDSFGTPSKT